MLIEIIFLIITFAVFGIMGMIIGMIEEEYYEGGNNEGSNKRELL